jgi:8-oxo-dGTP diphosphatase
MTRPGDATLFLVRHAKAGSRTRWNGEDARRPLSKPGRRQAHGLVEGLADAAVRRVVSSPFVRCRETVEPLSAARGLTVELDERLAEGRGPYGAMAIIRELGPGGVLCSHGDVITELLWRLERDGLDLGGEPLCEKGSTWILELAGDRVTEARYLPPAS